MIESFVVPAPPLPEQRAIAHILGTLDDKIELNRRMSETLEQMARAIFKAWFVDFEPVRAKMEGRWRRSESLPGLPAHLYDLFPDRLVDSELGEIPEGWRVSQLGDVADVNWGDTNTTKASYVDKGYQAYSASGPDGFLPYYDFDRVGVVLSAIGANAGISWLALGKWSCIKNTIRFWATNPDVSTEYLYHATLGREFWPLRGSAQPFISQGDARAVRVAIPRNGLARVFGEVVGKYYTRIDSSNRESRTLAALRDALLPKLISGELRVKDAERFLKERGL
jgi:type I restriction enzyme S subunit